jgi:hypothetical protein
MKIRTVEIELFDADRRTNIATFRNFAIAPKNTELNMGSLHLHLFIKC